MSSIKTTASVKLNLVKYRVSEKTVSVFDQQYRVSQKNARRLIWRKLKTTVFTRSARIFSESSYFNLKFSITQPKTG